MTVLLCLLGLTLMGAPRAHATSALSPLGRRALDRLSQCLQSSPDLAALVVIDESQSLENTDRDNVRAQVLPALVDQLGELAALHPQAGKHRVDLAVSTFAAGYTEWLPWQQLTASSARRVSSTLRRELPSKNKGQLTDYVAALKGARSTMAAGTARFTGSQAPCKLMVWFTDGALDVGSPAENAAAGKQLCSASGPVNALRDDGVITAAVLLLDRGRLAALPRDRRSELENGSAQLQAAAEGRATGPQGKVSCDTASASEYPGVYLEGDVNALAGIFAQIIERTKGGHEGQITTGPPITLRVDPGVASFSVVINAPRGLTLAPPSGATLNLSSGASGAAPVGDTTARVRWTGQTATIDVPVTKQGTGRWLLRRTGSDEPIGFYLFADLDVTIADADLVAGEESAVRGAVRRGDGSAFDPRVFKATTLTLEQTGSGSGGPVPVRLGDDGAFTGRFTPSKSATAVRLVARFTARTAGGDVFVVSRASVQPVTALGYPPIRPTELRLGSVQRGGDTASATLYAKGPSQGPATVCIVRLRAAADSTLSGLSVRPAARTCQSLKTNQQVGIPVTVKLEKATVQGHEVRGVVEISRTRAASSTVGSTAELTSTVPFTVQVLAVHPPKWLFALILVSGFLLPLLLMYGVQALAKRLLLDRVMTARVPVEIQLPPSVPTLRRRDASGPLITHNDLTYIQRGNRRASCDMGSNPPPDTIAGEQLRARQSINPFASPHGEVIAPRDAVVLSLRTPDGNRNKGGRARIPLRPDDEAYLLVDKGTLASATDDEAVPATLVTLTLTESTPNLGTVAQTASGRAAATAGTWATALRAVKGRLAPNAPEPPVAEPRADGSTTGGSDDPWGLAETPAARGSTSSTRTSAGPTGPPTSAPTSGASVDDWGLAPPTPIASDGDTRPRRRPWRRTASSTNQTTQHPPDNHPDW